MSRTVAYLLVLLATTPLALGNPNPPDPLAPAAAIAVISSQNAIVTWAPGAAMPDAFNVYGFLDHESLVLLATVPGNELNAEVPRLLPTSCAENQPLWLGCTGTDDPLYAVSAIVGDVESSMTVALLVSSSCIIINPTIPPSIAIGCKPEVSVEPNLPGSPDGSLQLH